MKAFHSTPADAMSAEELSLRWPIFLLLLAVAPLVILLLVAPLDEQVHVPSVAISPHPLRQTADGRGPARGPAKGPDTPPHVSKRSSIARETGVDTPNAGIGTPNVTERSRALLDGSLEAAVRAARPPTKLLMLTFGNSGVADHLRNFCGFARRAGIAHVVGAVDVAAFRLLVAEGVPAYLTPLARERYVMDGSNSHSSSSWKRFASMRTGEVARLVDLGYDVLHSDTDIVWLRDPTPYLMCTPAARAGEFGEGMRVPRDCD